MFIIDIGLDNMGLFWLILIFIWWFCVLLRGEVVLGIIGWVFVLFMIDIWFLLKFEIIFMVFVIVIVCWDDKF